MSPGSARARSASRAVSWVSTSGGINPETSPPNMATSLTSEEARNDHSGAHCTNTVSTSVSEAFLCALWSS